MTPKYYSQNDKRWGRIPFTSTNNPKQTIGSSGCGTTCVSMILSTWIDPTMCPDFVSKLCVDNGFRTVNQGTDFRFFPFISKKYMLKLVESYKTDEVVEYLKKGSLVVCSMTKGYFTQSGHFILAYGVENGQIFVHDPAHQERNKASIELFKRECQKYFIFERVDQVMDWKQILQNVSEQSSEWEKGISAVVKATTENDLGSLNVLKFLPTLIEKVYTEGKLQK